MLYVRHLDLLKNAYHTGTSDKTGPTLSVCHICLHLIKLERACRINCYNVHANLFNVSTCFRFYIHCIFPNFENINLATRCDTAFRV